MRTAPLVAAAGLIAASALPAAEEASVWPRAALQAYAEKLAPKINEQHYAIEALGDFGSHRALAVHREGNGPAESHAAETDFYVVQQGSATLRLGGEIADAKQTEPGEIRGSAIRGGESVKIGPGDVVNIPPGLPHQIVLGANEKVTYLILKVRRN